MKRLLAVGLSCVVEGSCGRRQCVLSEKTFIFLYDECTVVCLCVWFRVSVCVCM